MFARAATLVALLQATTCRPPPIPPKPVPPAPARESGQARPFEHGKASYYADSLAGHRTASGEKYDPHAFTAAHRTLPFGTWVDVARADGRTVRVRINDRGPFTPGRVIDLSRAAAEALDMIKAGVIDVDLVRVP